MILTRTSCESCGPVVLEGDRYAVSVDSTSDVCCYRFDCPGCGRANRQGTSSRVAMILTCLGAQPVVESAADPITKADVSAF